MNLSEKTPALERFDFIEAQRRVLKEQIARATLRAVRIERLLMGVEEEVEAIIRGLPKSGPVLTGRQGKRCA